jgi:hypothetical protein
MIVLHSFLGTPLPLGKENLLHFSKEKKNWLVEEAKCEKV